MKNLLKKQLWLLLLSPYMGLVSGCKTTTVDEITPPTTQDSVKTDVAFWMTRADQSALFQKQNTSLLFNTSDNSNLTIDVDTTQTYQSIDGFGFALTGGSATLINSLDAAKKEALLQELFLTDTTHIGISYLRISIGASDLSATPFTYDEMPAGQTDINLQSFSIAKEETDLIPILKQIIALNPSIKIIATPWTAPTWMKSNNSYEGGSLIASYYDTYARYFVKYIQAMQAEGIPITAITPQNEPLNAYNNPSMLMQANEEASFVKNYLGPQFNANNLNTKIVIYDHNLDQAIYPLTVLQDSTANKYIDGSAFHLYAGDISTMSSIHQSFPSKNLYFTEQYTASTGNFNGDLQWHTNNLIIGATRNWSKNVLEWNLASDPNMEPHTIGGCSTCLGAITIGSNNVIRNVSYYIIAHASKFVRPGSVRIASTIVGDLQNVAFKTPDGKKVLIVLNNGTATSTFNIRFNQKSVSPTLMAGAVGTFIW